MDSGDISLLSTFSPLHLVRLASIPRKWNPTIRDQIKDQKIQNILTFNVPIDAMLPDASVIGAFDVQTKVPNKLGEIFSKLLFTIAAAVTIETPPYDAQGRTASNVEQTIRREAKARGTLPSNNNDFKLGGLMYELTYNAFEILRSEDGVIVGYRVWFFIADKGLYDIASRIVTLFELNIARKEELTSKKNIFKAMLASIENKKNNALTRPPGPGYRMAYENYYLDLTRPRQWAKIIRMYSVMGLEDGSNKKGYLAGDEDDKDNENSQDTNESFFSFVLNEGDGDNNNNKNNSNLVEESEKRLYKVLTAVSAGRADGQGFDNPNKDGEGDDDKNHTSKFTRFNASTLNTRHVSKDWGENFTKESHPWNPINSLNKECAMALWTSKVRDRQRNIAEYFDISSNFPGSKEDAKMLSLEEMLSLGVEDSQFSDFPFHKDVFVLERDYVVPSMLFIMLPPHMLQEGSEFDRFLNIEKKRNYLYSKKMEELTESEKIERGFYDLMVVKSLPAPEAEKVKDIDLKMVNKLKETFEDTVESLMSNFANTGKFNGKEDPGDGTARIIARDEDEDLEFNLDKDYFERHDVFLKLRKKNTMAWKYLESKYDKASKEYKILKKMLESTNTWEFWRAMKYAKEVSPVVVKTRNWFFKLPPEKQWPNVSSKYTENLSLFGDMTLRHIIYISEIERCVTNTRLARQLSKYRHNAFKYEDDRNHQRNNACIPGPGMGGKSFLLDMLANTCTPGCVHETTYVSEQAYGISGVIDGEIVILHETSKEFLGAEGNENKLRMFKERLEKEVVHTTTFDVGPAKDNGERRRKKTACSCQGLTVFASNVNISKADGPLLSRFMTHMVPVRKGMPVGYRVKDRQKTQETELNNKDIRDDERHQQVLTHTYVFFLENMIKANVFGRQVLMGTTVETTNAIIEELQKKHKMDGVDIRLNSQIELVNRSTCVEYAVMATHFTPLSFKWSRTGDKINEYNPMIIPEMVLKFLYVTKEMIVHTLTLESEFWEKNLINLVFKNISRFLLSIPSQVEFLRTSSGGDGMDATYDKNYVWITNQEKHQVFDELGKCIDDPTLTAAEMETLIDSVKYKVVDPESVRQHMTEFENEYQRAYSLKQKRDDHTSPKKAKEEQVENMDIEECEMGESVHDVDGDDGFGDIPLEGDMGDIIAEMNDVEDLDDITSIKSKDEFMDDESNELVEEVKKRHNEVVHKQKNEENKRKDESTKASAVKNKKSKGKSGSNATVVNIEPTTKRMKFVRTGFHQGEFYVAFHIGELKRIEHEFGTAITNPVVDAIKHTLGTLNYETYPQVIMDALKQDYGVTDEHLVHNKLMTGLEGNPIVIPIEVKQGVNHELIVPVSKYSPTITISRSNRRMLVHNYNYIPTAAQMMLFENKRMESMVNGFQEHAGRIYRYDMDYENYIQNCQLNGDDPFDEMSLVSLPIFTKRVVKSAVEYFYPKMVKERDLRYPRDFFEAETKKVVNIFLHNNVATNDTVTQIVKRIENPATMKTFGFDDNGNYIQLNVDDGWGSITDALGIPSGVATRSQPIKKSQLINIMKEKGMSHAFLSKDSLIDNTLNNTDVGEFYTMELVLQGDKDTIESTAVPENNNSSEVEREESNRGIENNTNVRINSDTLPVSLFDEGSNASYFSSDSNMSQGNGNPDKPRIKASIRMRDVFDNMFNARKPQRSVNIRRSSSIIPHEDSNQGIIDESSQKSEPAPKKRKLASLYDGDDSDDGNNDNGDLARTFKKLKK